MNSNARILVVPMELFLSWIGRENLNIAPMGTASFFCFDLIFFLMTNRRSKKRYSGQRVEIVFRS